MGNQLVRIAPSQIYPVEHYIQDLQDPKVTQELQNLKIRFTRNLGSTRFFKVAKCDSEAGPMVVKVFVIPPSNDVKNQDEMIQYHINRLRDLRNTLAPTFNCLAFSACCLGDRAGFIIRQFGKYSLYDRISTRPFLTNLEKRWLAFQLLLAVEQCHKLGVCHGDIKLENILVSSWSWLTLTDFASFKPTFLPEDNPADFSYFFDTSRRRVCYIAPERFVGRASITETVSAPLPSVPVVEGEVSAPGGEAALTQRMDVFSAGCCVAELFTDGIPVFDFSQLLEYRVGKYKPEEVLAKIEDVDVRGLISHMISKDPAARLSIEEYLEQERGKVFPENFYTFLQPYISMFSRSPPMSTDQKIQRIHRDLDHLETLLASEDPGERIDGGCLVIVTNVVVSCVRSLQLTTSKLACLEVIGWLAERLTSDLILERILPQLIYFLTPTEPSVPSVVSTAVSVLVRSLGHVTSVPRSEAKTFPEYILPVLSPLAKHQSVSVRCALARNLAALASLASKWLDLVISASPPAHAATDYHSELSTLHKNFEDLVTALLEDSNTSIKRDDSHRQDNSVKQVLINESATKLAVWLGRQKAIDVLLSHMFTFLNDTDSQLRYCFYDNISGVASSIGWHCSAMLKPLMEQGLWDPEEMVVSRTISAISDLVNLGLLEKVAVFEILKVASPFLLHPNLWIRQATAGLVAAVAGGLDPVGIQVKLSSIVSPFLKSSLIQVDAPHLLLSHASDPVPRPVLEAVVRYSDTQALMAVLEERQQARKLARISGGSGTVTQQPVYPEMTNQLRTMFARLAEAGMLPEVEDKVLALREYIIRMARVKTGGRELMEAKKQENPIIDCGLSEAEKFTEKLSVDEPRRSDSGEDWRGSETTGPASEADQPLQAPCKAQLARLVSGKRAEYDALTSRKERLDMICSNSPGHNWKPRGVLVAHLAEHTAGITKLASIPDTTLMASTSTDGTLRIWDLAKIESGKQNFANKARQVYNRHVPLDGLAASSHNNILSFAARDGSISVFNIVKQDMVCSRSIDTEELGSPVDMMFCDLGPAPLLFYSTSFGSIVGWDLRKPGNAISFKQDLRHGLTTALSVAGEETWLAAGTSSGVVSVWDLRFRLQVMAVKISSVHLL